MLEELDIEEARTAVLAALKANSAYSSIDENTLEDIAQQAIELDIDFMDSAGVSQGTEYDEEKAYAHITGKLKEKFPKQQNLVNGLVDDYMEAFEAYLESAGLISWDGE